jgi:hypothetical protein
MIHFTDHRYVEIGKSLMHRRLLVVTIGLCVGILFLSIFRLESAPPFWFDEGWTLTAARNWLEKSHYGPFLNGRPAPRGMEGAFTYTAPIAAAFRLFGVGVYQGRLVAVVFALCTLALLCHLTWRLCGVSIAVATLAILTLMPAYPGLHPIVIGRQVLGEMPAFFYLLAGYTCLLLLASGRDSLAVLLASFFWSLAINTKTQILPFFSVSILVPLMLLLFYKRWRLLLLLGSTFILSLLGSELVISVWGAWIRSQTVPRVPVSGMYNVVALVDSLPARLFALIVLISFGLPTLLGLCFGVWSFFKTKNRLESHLDFIRFSLLVLASSWFAWYLLMSVGWIRYLFPPILFGSIFLAELLCALTNKFDFSTATKQALSLFSRCQFNRRSLGALLAVLIIGVSVPRTLYMFYRVYFLDADVSVKEAAQFLNTHTAPKALIETYDSELFFFLERPYHFPEDQLHVQLIRRTFLYENDLKIDYDPLSANPGYLVVGPHSKQWKLYEPALQNGAFRLIKTYSRYQIYERVR